MAIFESELSKARFESKSAEERTSQLAQELPGVFVTDTVSHEVYKSDGTKWVKVIDTNHSFCALTVKGGTGGNMTPVTYNPSVEQSVVAEITPAGIGAAAKSHSHNNYIPMGEKGAANGVATLDSKQLIPISQIPKGAIEELHIMATQSASLTALQNGGIQIGDVVKITGDGNKMYYVTKEFSTGDTFAKCFEVFVAGSAAVADTANATKGTLTLQGNNGISLFAFDGSTNKTHKLTPTNVGLGGVLTLNINGKTQTYDGTNSPAPVEINATTVGAAPTSHTHLYAGSSSAGGSAKSTQGALTIKLNGVSQPMYNGSSNRTIDITPESIGATSNEGSIKQTVVQLNGTFDGGTILKTEHGCGDYPIVRVYDGNNREVNVGITISKGNINWSIASGRAITNGKMSIVGSTNPNILIKQGTFA